MLMEGRGEGPHYPVPVQAASRPLREFLKDPPPPRAPHPRPPLSPGGRLFPCSVAPSLWLGAWGGAGLPHQASTAPWPGLSWFCLLRCEGMRHAL